MSAQLVQANVRAYLSFRKEKGKDKSNFPVCLSHMSLESTTTERTESKKTNAMLAVEKDIGHMIANAQCPHPVRLRKTRRVQPV